MTASSEGAQPPATKNTLREPELSSLDRIMSLPPGDITDAELDAQCAVLRGQRDKWRLDEASGKRSKKVRALTPAEQNANLEELLDL